MAGDKRVSACRWLQRTGGRAQYPNLLDTGLDDDDGDCDGDDDYDEKDNEENHQKMGNQA